MTMTPGAHDAPSPSQRRRLARAIRGPLSRFDVDAATLYARLRANGVSHEALLIAEAFGRGEGGSDA